MLRKNLCTAASESNAALAQPFGGPPPASASAVLASYYTTNTVLRDARAYRRIVVCGQTLSERGEAGLRRQPARRPQ
jgi:hypothetical protein